MVSKTYNFLLQYQIIHIDNFWPSELLLADISPHLGLNYYLSDSLAFFTNYE